MSLVEQRRPHLRQGQDQNCPLCKVGDHDCCMFRRKDNFCCCFGESSKQSAVSESPEDRRPQKDTPPGKPPGANQPNGRLSNELEEAIKGWAMEEARLKHKAKLREATAQYSYKPKNFNPLWYTPKHYKPRIFNPNDY